MTQRSSVRVIPASLFRILFIALLPAMGIMLLVTHKTRVTGESFEFFLRPGFWFLILILILIFFVRVGLRRFGGHRYRERH
jgi:hypothetical protein